LNLLTCNGSIARMRIVYLTLFMIVLLNIGNPCEIGLQQHPLGNNVSAAKTLPADE